MSNIENIKLSFNCIIAIFFFIGGDISNCIFILISGYLMYEKKVNFQRWFLLILQVFFYSFIGFGFLLLYGYDKDITYFIKRMFFPFHSNVYWFICSYIVLYIFFPVFSLIIKTLNKKQNSFYLVCMLIIFTVLPILGYKWLDNVNSIFKFITIFCIGSFIKKYDIRIAKKYKSILLFFVLLLINELIVILRIQMHTYPWGFVWGLNLPVIVTAIFLFIGFHQLDFKSKKKKRIVSSVVPYVFGVYLFHNGGLLPVILDIFAINEDVLKHWYYAVYLIAIAIIIFIFGVWVDYLRQRFVESPVLNVITPFVQRINEIISNYIL